MLSESHRPLRVAVAASGTGRSLQNLVLQESRFNYRVEALISSKPHSPAEDFARKRQLPIFQSSFGKEASLTLAHELDNWLQAKKIDTVALAGFLKPFPILASYARSTVNIHPALLPKYGGKGMYGMHVHRAVLAAGEVFSGATVHFVTSEYDEGTIIAQIKVDLKDLAEAESVAARVFEAECVLYPKVLDGLSSGQLPLPEGGILQMEELTSGHFTTHFR